MGNLVTLGRVLIGRDVHVLMEDDDCVYLEGECRLRPGHSVVILPAPEQGLGQARTAMVWTWEVARLGSGRPVYEGICWWSQPGREDRFPPEGSGGAVATI
jgi:hypothetical protein